MKIYQNILIPSEIDRISMDISDLCFAELDSSWQKENVSSLYTRIYCVKSGRGFVYCGGKTIELTAGNIYIIPSELEFSYKCDERLEKYYFHIQVMKDGKDDIFAQIKDIIILKNKQMDIDFLDKYWNENNLCSVMFLNTFLYGIVFESLASTNINTYIERYSAQINRVIKYIEENLNAKMTAGEIAAAFNVSESFIHKAFKREIGISINKYISQKCLIAAKSKLRLSDLSIKEISESLGYCDQFYFSRKFSQEFRMSPSSYRKQSGEQL
ncbi:MAG: helix-turn-helix domain-containing protein [Clostridia bacterium]|nr:helix-turn-helix domain-containing protein [Clostridia bacterium]